MQSRFRGSRAVSTQPSIEIISISETILGAFAFARATLALIVLGGFLLSGFDTSNTDEALLKIVFVLIGLLGLVSALRTIVGRWRGRPIAVNRLWTSVLIDSSLAIGVMASIDAETSPLAWIALIVPVVEAAVLFSMVPAGIVWLGLSIAFLALRLTADQAGDPGSDTLTIAVQQVLAVFLVSGPAALLSDSAHQRISQLSDARRNADRMADRLRRIAQAANDMSKENTVDSVLKSVSKSAVSIGFDHADVATQNDDGTWSLFGSHSTGSFRPPPLELLTESAVTTSSNGITDGDPEFRQVLHTHGLASGHSIMISADDGSSPSHAVLRAWSSRRPANEQELRSLELLAGHAREIHRTAVQLAEAKAHSDRLLYEVRHDGLTGLANRDFVLKTLEKRIEQGSTMAIFFIDLDGFKQINDTLGHRAGDTALTLVAERLTKRLRSGALAGRMGGDEFIVVVPVTAFDSMVGLEAFANQLVESISDPMIIDGSRTQLGASIGLAIHTAGFDADQLISQADNAMYTAKRAGGGVHVASYDGVPLDQGQDAS